MSNCQKCHGPEGKGDGPDSDPRMPAADLTDGFRAELNPDGVLYYRIFNGKPPVMPAFKSSLTQGSDLAGRRVHQVDPQVARSKLELRTEN